MLRSSSSAHIQLVIICVLIFVALPLIVVYTSVKRSAATDLQKCFSDPVPIRYGSHWVLRQSYYPRPKSKAERILSNVQGYDGGIYDSQERAIADAPAFRAYIENRPTGGGKRARTIEDGMPMEGGTRCHESNSPDCHPLPALSF